MPWNGRMRRPVHEAIYLPFPLPLRQSVIDSRDLKTSYLEEQDIVPRISPRIDCLILIYWLCSCVRMWMGVYVLQCTHGSQRTTFQELILPLPLLNQDLSCFCCFAAFSKLCSPQASANVSSLDSPSHLATEQLALQLCTTTSGLLCGLGI